MGTYGSVIDAMFHQVSSQKFLVRIHSNWDDFVDEPQQNERRENSLEMKSSEILFQPPNGCNSPNITSTARRGFECPPNTIRRLWTAQFAHLWFPMASDRQRRIQLQWRPTSRRSHAPLKRRQDRQLPSGRTSASGSKQESRRWIQQGSPPRLGRGSIRQWLKLATPKFRWSSPKCPRDHRS